MMKKMISIIDYKAGNLTSVKRAVSYLGYDSIITSDSEKISNSERIIFPGVGQAGSAMESLRQMNIDKAIKNAFNKGTPVLGICLGTQIIMDYSEEKDSKCIGIVPGFVKAFDKNMKDDFNNKLKIPHMGWNKVKYLYDHPVFENINEDFEFYFVHSYYPFPENNKYTLGITNYGIDFVSVIAYNNLIATQFHPEKSGEPGLAILNNFCKWKP